MDAGAGANLGEVQPAYLTILATRNRIGSMAQIPTVSMTDRLARAKSESFATIAPNLNHQRIAMAGTAKTRIQDPKVPIRDTNGTKPSPTQPHIVATIVRKKLESLQPWFTRSMMSAAASAAPGSMGVEQ